MEASHKMDCISSVVQKEKRLILVLDVARALNIDDIKSVQNSTAKAA
jgi:hypothetical protein